MGKPYVTVNSRLKYFREEFIGYKLLSEVISNENGKCLIKATILDDKNIAVATGHACEKDGVGFINRTSHVENCETSAWGRALGNFGIGISAAVASYEEVANAIEQRKPVTKEKKYKDSVCAKVESINKDNLPDMLENCFNTQEAIDIWWLLTKEQQADKEIQELFKRAKEQLQEAQNG